MAAEIAASPRLEEALRAIGSGVFSPDDVDRYRGLIDGLRHDDRFMVCADFDDYWNAQARVEALWRKPNRWWKAAMLNTARVGWFSSDRTIREYASEIWRVPYRG
ncbi:glycogen/starch/alpha-glucan phosphorylase [compost metagenome]